MEDDALGRSDEAITESALRQYPLWMVGGVFKLLSQAPDVDAQKVDVVDVLVTPDDGQQRAALMDPAGRLTKNRRVPL